MKNNPLFFDSTKFRGDTIVVDVELTGVELALGEVLALHILREENPSQIPLQARGVRKWITQVRMEYQQTAQIQFCISRDGAVVETSEPRTVLASYTIHQNWERMPKAEVLRPVEMKTEIIEKLVEKASELQDRAQFLPMIVEKELVVTRESPFSNENLQPPPSLRDLGV